MANDKVQVNLLFFAKSRELTAVSEAKIEIPSTITGKQLLEEILSAYPVLSQIEKNVLVAVNQEYVGAEQTVLLKAGDEIAVIPPISGG